jgi:hypothetical protein
MTIRSARHAERLLAQLDPADSAEYAAAAAERAATLHDVLSLAHNSRNHRRPAHRRRLVLVGAALAVVAGAGIAVVDLASRRPEPVYTATPALLRYEMSAQAPATADLLHAIAAAAEKSAAKGAGVQCVGHDGQGLLARHVGWARPAFLTLYSDLELQMSKEDKDKRRASCWPVRPVTKMSDPRCAHR